MLFDFNSQKDEKDWKSIVGFDASQKPKTPTTAQKPKNYVEKIHTHKYAKDLEIDAKGNINMKQFDLATLKQKYDAKSYAITTETNYFGYEITTIRDRNNPKNIISITDTKFGIYYEKESTNSYELYEMDTNGQLFRSVSGKDKQNYNVLELSNGQIINERKYKDNQIKYAKHYENGEVNYEAFYDTPEGDYRLDYKNGQITQKYMIDGKDRDVYYIYENGKPVKKMFAASKQSYADENTQDTLVEDLLRTERLNNLVEELRKDIYAKDKLKMPTTRPTLAQHVMSIKAEDVVDVMTKYEEVTGQNLLDAIKNEVGMSVKNPQEHKKIYQYLENLYIENGGRWETGEYIGAKLTDKKGINPLTAEEFSRYVKLINPENVIGVLREFETPKILGYDATDILGKMNVDVSGYNNFFEYTGLINNIMWKGGLNYDQKKELVEHVLTCLDKSADDNSSFIYTKDIVNSIRQRLNEGKWTMGRDSLRLQIRALNSWHGGHIEETKANSKFDLDFKQGSTGDCWLVAGIISVVKKPAGKKALESCLKVDKDGNVTVNMKGVGKVYKISAQEIAQSVHLSIGDADVRAIEIAMDRYIKENSLLRPSIDGNRTKIFYKAFFGNGHSFSYSEDFNNPNKFYSLAIPFDFDALDKDGKKVAISGIHEIAIVGSDKDYVHVLDPNKGTSEPLRIPWAKFRIMYAVGNNMDVCEI